MANGKASTTAPAGISGYEEAFPAVTAGPAAATKMGNISGIIAANQKRIRNVQSIGSEQPLASMPRWQIPVYYTGRTPAIAGWLTGDSVFRTEPSLSGAAHVGASQGAGSMPLDQNGNR
jgi:hypothetical protein